MRTRGAAPRAPGAHPEYLLSDAVPGSNAVGYSNYPQNVVAGFVRHAADNGIDIFRIFDSLNYLPNLKAAMEAVRETHAVCEAAICYTGDILDPNALQVLAGLLCQDGEGTRADGRAHPRDQGHGGPCRPYAAHALVKALREEIGIPIHFHTHDTSGINAASVLQASDAGVDIVDLALASMSGSTSQPNLNSIVAALQHTKRDTGLDLDALNEFSDYWEQVREFYAPSIPRRGAARAEVYLHEMPGGQFTNLKEQANSMGLGHRWPEIARCYAEVNQLLGDIVKVTPSSKVVGDMALFLFTRGIKPADVVNLPPGTPFPASVIDMLSGGLGKPWAAGRKRWSPRCWAEEAARLRQSAQDRSQGRPSGSWPEVQARGDRRRSLQPSDVPGGIRGIREI